MTTLEKEPTIAVGLLTDVDEVEFHLTGEFLSTGDQRLSDGRYRAAVVDELVEIYDQPGHRLIASPELALMPGDTSSCLFTLSGVTIGIGFHWERQQEQSFRGALKLRMRPDHRLAVINDISLESYLTSVISSEMRSSSPQEFLKAHAIISRSWLLAQLHGQKSETRIENLESSDRRPAASDHLSIIRWYTRENHTDFDVCADDHCQRYQGLSKVFSPSALDAVSETRGVVLTYNDEICDARFSKCCGGMTEGFRAAWEDIDIPYLTGVYDGAIIPADHTFPLTQEPAARDWITNAPPAYCHTSDQSLISQILPDFDQETQDFFRWEVTLSQDEIQALLKQKLDLDVGAIAGLEPLERGVSARIVRLKICGARARAIIGKELEIRRVLSPSHLYSSAFVIHPEGAGAVPERFRLTGAGWGHGVGLCQIGAAVMAQQGKSYQEILSHYYRGSRLHVLYA